MRNAFFTLVLLTTVEAAPALGQPVCHAAPTPRVAGGGPQVADTGFSYALQAPMWAMGSGPAVLLDEAHHNFHTIAGRYAPFVKLLRSDGFTVLPLRTPASAGSLASAKILVIANALAARNATGNNWTLPTPPAFTDREVEAIRKWVDQGGSLMLIADHMPFPGAASTLAKAFGFILYNGFATDSTCVTDELVFTRAEQRLADHPVTRGRNAGERVDSIRSFTGEGFKVPDAATVLMVLPRKAVILMPARAWAFADSTTLMDASLLAQGAVLPYGKGRVAVFGEAAMFSAQVSGAERRPMGMNAPRAAHNPQFLLNVMHWLAGALPAR